MDLLHTAHVPAGDGPFPTVVALHGWGASAHDLIGLAPFFHGGGACVICPQGRVRVPIAPGLDGYGWFPLSQGGPPDPVEIVRARDELSAFIDAAAEHYPVDRRKLALLGFSQGGVMAYDLALRDPSRFAGLAALSSWLPEPLAAQIERQDAHTGFPVMVIHGTEDPMIPVQRAQESRSALQALDVALSYREYEMAHEIRPEALRDIVEWLEGKVISPIQLL